MIKSGIYKILNTINKKVYIGSTFYIPGRLGSHRFHLRNNSHHNIYLQKSWNKYGEFAFEFVVLEYVEKDKLIEREQYWIDTSNCCDSKFGYNLMPNARSSLGRVFTPESKAKMSAWQIGRKMSDEAKAKMSLAKKGKPSILKGRKASAETVTKMKLSAIGKKKSENTKKKIKESALQLRNEFKHQVLTEHISAYLGMGA